jgi:endonuclease-8
VLEFANGEVTIWSASLRFLETRDARATYDFSVDVLSDSWDPNAALVKVHRSPAVEIGDLLLDQTVFAGVGNIIKNEVLFRTRTSPLARVSALSTDTIERIVADARTFSERFLELRRGFALRKNLEIYGRSVCPGCGGKVLRRIHGERQRRSFFCVTCQKVRLPRGIRRKGREQVRKKRARNSSV